MPNPPRPASLPTRSQRLLQAELWPDERILWSSRPDPATFRRASSFLVVVGIFVTGACGGMVVLARHSKMDGTMALALVVVSLGALFGLFLISSPLWAGRNAERKIYAVTDRRVLILRTNKNRVTHSQTYLPDRLGAMERLERPDGSGNLIFERYTQPNPDSGTVVIKHGFTAINNVRGVEQLIVSTFLLGLAPSSKR